MWFIVYQSALYNTSQSNYESIVKSNSKAVIFSLLIKTHLNGVGYLIRKCHYEWNIKPAEKDSWQDDSKVVFINRLNGMHFIVEIRGHALVKNYGRMHD